MARSLDLPAQDVVLCNLYYDLLKVVIGRSFGCTAFALETPDGKILHARNLDWWTENAALSQYTATTRFVGAPAGEFTTIGWPGFVGAFSGIAPGRFAVTLNAALSPDQARPATPVVLLLRTVLEEARSFNEALDRLANTLLPCDCLLLLTGVRAGELVVIERTPSRHALRHATDGFVCVTNDYRELAAPQAESTSELLATCCDRFDRIESLIHAERPADPAKCFHYLNDPVVRMNMTVQQMVFCAATGQHWLEIPSSPIP